MKGHNGSVCLKYSNSILINERKYSMTELNCRQCGKPIVQKLDWRPRAFCDYSCRMAWHNARRLEAVARWHKEHQQREEAEPEVKSVG
jgi:endogenous inhibitor of DNA gyrase (YacG/DUF329 family)